MPAERRTSNRCPVLSDKIQITIHMDKETYFVKDISKGGLAFKYSPVPKPLQTEKISILAIGYNKFHLPQISCKTVYDIATLMEGNSFRGRKIRLRGLKFIELSKEQEERIDSLLNYCFDRCGQQNHFKGGDIHKSNS